MFPRDLHDGGSAHSSHVNFDSGSPHKESPRMQRLPSLAEALALPPMNRRVATKPSTKISLEAMLPLSPVAQHPASQRESGVNPGVWTSSESSLGMLPVDGVYPW